MFINKGCSLSVMEYRLSLCFFLSVHLFLALSLSLYIYIYIYIMSFQ